MNKTAKGLQHYFGVSDEIAEAILSEVVTALEKHFADPKLESVNQLKHVVAQEVMAKIPQMPEVLVLLGIMIEQGIAAIFNKPKKGFLGKIK